MNQEQKAQRYDLLLNQYRDVERQISSVPKLPLEETIESLDNREYVPHNLMKVTQLKQQLKLIEKEIERLY